MSARSYNAAVAYLRLREFPDDVPPLEHGSGSWIGSTRDGRVLEVFERADAATLARGGWTVETSGTYLARINREIRQRETP